MNIEQSISVLFATWDDGRLTDKAKAAKVGAYVLALRDIPADELEMVVKQAIATLTFMPAPGQLIEIHRQLRGVVPAIDGAAQCWKSIMKAMKDGRYYFRAPKYGDPFKDYVTGEVVAIMGWDYLRNSETPGIDMARAMKLHDAISAQRVANDRLLGEFKEMRAERQLPAPVPEGTPVYEIVSRVAMSMNMNGKG